MSSPFKNINVVYYYVKDWDRAKKFYREVLGWPVAWSSEEIGWEEYGVEEEAHVAINRWDEGSGPMPPHHGGATLTLTVDNVHAVTEALRARGVKCGDVVIIPGVVAYGTFFDPEGNRIQFAGPPPQG